MIYEEINNNMIVLRPPSCEFFESVSDDELDNITYGPFF